MTTEGQAQGVGYRFTAERKHQGDYEFKNHRTGAVTTMPNSYFDQDAVTMGLDKELGDGRSLRFNWEHLDGKAGYGLMAPGYSQHHPTAYETTLENNVDATYRWGQDGGENLVKIYHNAADYGIHKGRDRNQPDKSLESRTTGAEWQQKWQINKNYALLGGFQNKELSNQAVFIENRWQLPKGWIITAGTRYDKHNVFGGKQTSRITANRELNSNTNMYLSWGQVFKAPNAEELYGQSQAIGNPNLRPETGDTLTLGINTKLRDDSSLKASIFTSHINDAISYYPIDASYMYWKFANLQEQKRQGLDLSLTKKIAPFWSVTAGYSHVEVKNKDQGGVDYYTDTQNGQPNGYRLSAQYTQGKWDAGLALRGASGRSTAAYTASSYWVVDLTASYQIHENLRTYAKVYNLTNRSYELLGANGIPGAYPMAARHLYFGLEQRI